MENISQNYNFNEQKFVSLVFTMSSGRFIPSFDRFLQNLNLSPCNIEKQDFSKTRDVPVGKQSQLKRRRKLQRVILHTDQEK